MKSRCIRWWLMIACTLGASAPVHADGEVNVYNWNNYIAEDTIAKFEAETGIRVTYDLLDSNEVLEGKLLAGRSGYDVVVPTSSFLGRQIQAGIYQPLQKERLEHYGDLDPALMKELAVVDPGNVYGLPYMWGTVGLGINRAEVVRRLGTDAPLDTWDLVFNPEILSRLDCGVAFLDSPVDIWSPVLNYLGKDPNSMNPADYQGEALTLMKSLKPYITYFHSSKYIDDLAAGEICVAIGWSGDIAQAKISAADAGNGVGVEYVLPREGTLMFIDAFAIPKDARHVDEAHRFIDFMTRPEIAAANTNAIWYANPVPSTTPMIYDAIRNDPSIYPPEAVMKKLWVSKVMPPRIDRVMNRAWTEVKTGR